MRGRAVRLKEDIAAQTAIPNVQAVVVFWNDFPAGLAEENRVVFLGGERLADRLREQSPKIDANTVPSPAAAIAATRPPECRTWWESARALGPARRNTAAEATLSTSAERRRGSDVGPVRRRSGHRRQRSTAMVL
jgi:hypothetical protein